jgi:hypothetical protein
MKQWKIVDWANNDIDTGGKTFKSFEDGWAWIDTFIPNENDAHEDLYVVEVE